MVLLLGEVELVDVDDVVVVVVDDEVVVLVDVDVLDVLVLDDEVLVLLVELVLVLVLVLVDFELLVDVLVLVEDDENVVVDVDVKVLVVVLDDEVVLVEEDDVVDVVVEDVVVETLVVAVEVPVDVWVVDGDVIWHPKNVPFFWRVIISFSADAKRLRRDSPVPSRSRSLSTSSITWMLPNPSSRQPTSNTLPSKLPPSKSVISCATAARPGAVTVSHVDRLFDMSTKLYRGAEPTLPPT